MDLTRAKADLEATLKQALQMADEPTKKGGQAMGGHSAPGPGRPVRQLAGGGTAVGRARRGALFVKLEEAGRKARQRLQDISSRTPRTESLEPWIPRLLNRFGRDAKIIQEKVDQEFDNVVEEVYNQAAV